MIVDAHQHFWDPARGDYGWLAPDMPLHRVFGPPHLEPLVRAEGIDGTVLVQAAPTDAETDYLLAMAAATPWVSGVVGWVALDAPDAATLVARRARTPYFVGLRPMLQDLDDPQWILRRENAAGLEAVARHALVFDALIRAGQLPVLDTLLNRYPEMTVVLDHAAKPPFGDREAMRAWGRDIAHVARHGRLNCKISGLLTELPRGGNRRLVEDCIHRLLDLFGVERLLWGSDWPVLTLAGDYGTWKRLVTDVLASHPAPVFDAVMGGNARRIYGLR